MFLLKNDFVRILRMGYRPSTERKASSFVFWSLWGRHSWIYSSWWGKSAFLKSEKMRVKSQYGALNGMSMSLDWIGCYHAVNPRFSLHTKSIHPRYDKMNENRWRWTKLAWNERINCNRRDQHRIGEIIRVKSCKKMYKMWYFHNIIRWPSDKNT